MQFSFLSSSLLKTSTTAFICSVEKAWFSFVCGIRQRSRQLCPYKKRYFRIMRALSSALQGTELLACRAGLRMPWEECPAVISISQLISFPQTPFPQEKDLLNPKEFWNITREKVSHSTDSRAVVSPPGFCEREIFLWRNWQELFLALWCTWWGVGTMRGQHMGTKTMVWTAGSRSIHTHLSMVRISTCTQNIFTGHPESWFHLQSVLNRQTNWRTWTLWHLHLFLQPGLTWWDTLSQAGSGA